MIRIAVVTLFLGSILTGCVTGQYLHLDHKPTEKQSSLKDSNVSLIVEDSRGYVLNKVKSDYFIGSYRNAFKRPFDVTTYKKVPLADLVKNDLKEELVNLGFGVNTGGKTLYVSILDWSFDGYLDGEFWYQIKVDVLNDKDEIIETDVLSDRVFVKGTVMGSAKGGFERDVPKYYDKIINSILRGNKRIIVALSS